jgi:uncharacterized protein YlxW (UPF0749 family)
VSGDPQRSEDPQRAPEGAHVAQLLAELVNNPRDAGYEAAAARRGGRPSSRWYDRPMLALGCAVLGFVLVVAYVHTHRAAPETAKVRQSLIDRVHAVESQGATLAATARALDDQLNAERDNALSGTSGLSAELRRAQLAAGQSAVRGPGVTVTLSEPSSPSQTAAPGRAGTTSLTAVNILSDQDVRSVVNELWSDGAEAIAVNGVRLTPTSAIRFAGQAVLVDFQPITSPYRIAAIGPPDQLDTAFAASPVASRYQTLSGADGIGFEFAEQAELSLPASPAVSLRFAHAATPSGAAASTSPGRGHR